MYVCVVDDCEIILRVKRCALDANGFQSVSAYQDSNQFLDELIESGWVPDVLLLDTEMPYISGYQLVLYLHPQGDRKQFPDLIMGYQGKHHKKLEHLAGSYRGKIILTSNNGELMHSPAESHDVPPEASIKRRELESAIHLCNETFRVRPDGTGMDNLISYLRSS